MQSTKLQYSLFGDISANQEELLKSDYAYKSLFHCDFNKNLKNNLSFKVGISQKVFPTKNFFVLNHGALSFLYKTDRIEVSKKFESDGDLKVDFLYNFQKIFSGNGIFFAKFFSNHSEGKILPQIGIKLKTPHALAEGKYDFDKTTFSNKLLLVSRRENEEYGLALAMSSNLKFVSLYKSSIYYKSSDLDISLTHSNPEKIDNSLKKINLSIFNKAHENLDIALNLKYNASADKNFKIVLGGSSLLSPNIKLKGKIDDNFMVATSIALDISKKVRFVLSSYFSFNPNSKKELLPHLPFGCSLSILDT